MYSVICLWSVFCNFMYGRKYKAVKLEQGWVANDCDGLDITGQDILSCQILLRYLDTELSRNWAAADKIDILRDADWYRGWGKWIDGLEVGRGKGLGRCLCLDMDRSQGDTGVGHICSEQSTPCIFYDRVHKNCMMIVTISCLQDSRSRTCLFWKRTQGRQKLFPNISNSAWLDLLGTGAVDSIAVLVFVDWLSFWWP